jgi:hypothetical protein
LRATISTADFATGLIAGLALERVKLISLRNPLFARAGVAAFEELERQATARDLRVTFHLRQDSLHGDAPVLRDAFSAAIQRGLGTLDGPEYMVFRNAVAADYASRYLEGVPGGADVFTPVARSFLDCMRGTVRE